MNIHMMCGGGGGGGGGFVFSLTKEKIVSRRGCGGCFVNIKTCLLI